MKQYDLYIILTQLNVKTINLDFYDKYDIICRMGSIISVITVIVVLIAIAFVSGEDQISKFGYFSQADLSQSAEDANQTKDTKKEARQADSTPANEDVKQNVSPYLNKVKISNVRVGSSSRVSYVSLKTNLKKEEEINLTDWQIETKNGIFFIPKGMEKFRTFSTKEPEDDITVKRGDKVYLYNGENPIGQDKNFRSNKCFGYLKKYDYFDFSISKRCPKAEETEIYHLSPCCKAFILKLGRCEFPDYSEDSEIYKDRECTAYLSKNFNYSGCFNNYHNNEDFLENTWHLYLEKELIVENDWDIVYLRDQNGLLVHEYSYGRPCCK